MVNVYKASPSAVAREIYRYLEVLRGNVCITPYGGDNVVLTFTNERYRSRAVTYPPLL